MHRTDEDSTPPGRAGRILVGRALLPGIAVFIALVAVACGSAGDGPPRPRVAVDANLWRTAWEISTAPQREALKDGEVTFAEYEAAALRTVQCLNDNGVTGEATYDVSTKTYSVAARWQSPTGREPSDLEKRAGNAACYAANWNGVNQAWSAQNQPSQQVLDQARAALAACLRDAGLDIPAQPRPDQLAAVQGYPAFLACSSRVGAEFGLANFGG